MRLYVSLCLSFIGASIVGTAAQSAPDVPSVSPAVKLPTGLSKLLFEGGIDNPKGEMTCYIVLYGMPGFQNAQAQGACYEAQTACLRLGLIQQFMHKEENNRFVTLYPGTEFPQEQLKEMLEASMNDTKLSIMGCAVATAASVITDSVIDQAGFMSPVALDQYNNVHHPSELVESPSDTPSPVSPPSEPPSTSSLEPLPTEAHEPEEEGAKLPKGTVS